MSIVDFDRSIKNMFFIWCF